MAVTKLNRENMKVELDRDDLVSLVKGTYPSYEIMDSPLIRLSGKYVGGFHDKWVWNDKFSPVLTEDNLWEMYNICKDSWK